MHVETYEATEVTADLSPECDAEALKLIASLGLKGQMAREPAANPVERNPYRHMTRDEQSVYAIVMPQRTKIEDYHQGPIPLRVLQVAAHAKDLGLPQLYVWHPEDARRDDPILVAQGHGWQDPLWLLARWGDVLLPFEQLRAKAVTKARDAYTTKVQRALAKTQAEVARLPHMPDTELLEKVSERTFHINDMPF